jgi:uncharacterized protein YjbI with pentapeptide repeats
MARSTQTPVPPRVSAPDLPSRLESADGLEVHGDHFQVAFAGLSDDVDGSHAMLTECRIPDAAVAALTLTGATLVDVAIDGIRATTVSARRSRMRRVAISGGRVGTLDLAEAELDEIELRGLRIDYLSMAAVTAADVLVADCVIGSIDLPQASLTRIRFESSRADEIDTRGLRAEDVDLRGLEFLSFTDAASLRGTTLSARQVELHAGAFAASLGIRIRDE